MKKIVLSFSAGIIVAVLFFFLLGTFESMNTKTGELLDRDTVFLHNGEVLTGWIINKNADALTLNLDGKTRILLRVECDYIQENTLAQYIRELL